MEKQTPASVSATGITAVAATTTLEARLFETPIETLDESIIRCEIEETDTHFALLIPRRISVDALVETRTKAGPGNLIHATLEAPAITCELYGTDGRSTKLVTKPIRTRLSFRLY